MAGKDRLKDSRPHGGRGKITVVMFQVEGDDQTLQDAIKTLGQGMEKLTSATPVYKYINAPVGSRHALPVDVDADASTIDGDASKTEADSYEEAPASAPKPAGSSRKRRIQKALIPLKGVDWVSDTPFRDYCDQKKPSSNPEKFVVIAGWFKNVRGEHVVTPPHVAAAFDVMDWQKPEDIGQVFRQTKHEKEWFDKGDKQMEWVLAQRGINHLDRMGKGDTGGDA